MKLRRIADSDDITTLLVKWRNPVRGANTDVHGLTSIGLTPCRPYLDTTNEIGRPLSSAADQNDLEPSACFLPLLQTTPYLLVRPFPRRNA